MAEVETEIKVNLEEPEKVVSKETIPPEEVGKKPSTPPKGSERWEEIYWEAQEGKRAREELAIIKEERAKDKEAIEEMRKWNKSIVESIDSVKGAIIDTTDDKELGDLETKLTSLKAEKKTAREKADFDRETAIDDSIVDVKIAIKEHKVMKAAAIAKAVIKKDESPVKDDESTLTPDEEKVYKTWAKDTEWFQKDPRMRKEALETEPEVWKDPDFKYATIEEVLDEVKKRVEEKFEYKPSRDGNRRQRQDAVEHSETGGKRITSVRLSPTEIAIQQGLGVSVEDFAKQKAIKAKLDSARGGAK